MAMAPRTKWSRDEWLSVAVRLVPLLDDGVTRYVALGRAMRKALPKKRQHDDPWISHTSAPSCAAFNKYVAIIRAMSDEERTALTAKPEPVEAPDAPQASDIIAIATKRAGNGKPDTERKLARKGADIGRKYSGAKWTTMEWALIARMVKWFKVHGVTLPLSRMVIEAQELVLDADRRRAITGIQASVNVKGGNALEKQIAEATGNIYLVSHIPFNPPLPPGADPVAHEQAQRAQETALSGVETGQVYLTPPPPQFRPQHRPMLRL